MSWSDLDLMALGPVLALAAALFISLSATMGQDNRVRKAPGAVEGHRAPPP